MWTIGIIALIAVGAYASMVGWDKFKGQVVESGKFTADKVEDVAEDVGEFAEDMKEDIEDAMFYARNKAEKMWPYLKAVGLPFWVLVGLLCYWIVADVAFSVILAGLLLGIPVMFLTVLLDIAGFATIFLVTKSRLATIAIYAVVVLGFLANNLIGQYSVAEMNTIASARNQKSANSFNDEAYTLDYNRKEFQRLNALTARKHSAIKLELDNLLTQEPSPVGRCLSHKNRGRWSKANCGAVTALRTELVNAKSRDEKWTAWQVSKNTFGSQSGGRTDASPFATSVHKMTGWHKDSISKAVFSFLAFLMALIYAATLIYVRDAALDLRDKALINMDRKQLAIREKHGLLVIETKPDEASYFTPTAKEKASGQLHVDLLAIFEHRLTPKEGEVLTLNGENGFHAIYKKHVLDDSRAKYEPLGPNFIAALNVISKDRTRIEATNNTILDWAEKGSA